MPHLPKGTQGAFDASVAAWSEYGKSARGQLRNAEVLHHLRAHLPGRGLRVLDAGGGTGELAADLARDGHVVTLLDFSPAMLAAARHQCDGLDVTLLCDDVSRIEALFQPGYFDAAICHSLLEFVGDAEGVVSRLARVVRPEGVLSVLVGNRYHATLREAIMRRDFQRARLELDEEVPATDLFGLPRHTYYPETMRQLLEGCGLRVIGEYGVRVFSDLLDPSTTDPADLLALELVAAARLPYRHIARFVQFIALKQ